RYVHANGGYLPADHSDTDRLTITGVNTYNRDREVFFGANSLPYNFKCRVQLYIRLGIDMQIPTLALIGTAVAGAFAMLFGLLATEGKVPDAFSQGGSHDYFTRHNRRVNYDDVKEPHIFENVVDSFKAIPTTWTT
ncbi:MAG: hypothetical protein NWF07_00800, partial [Candidatus Bathyarchaeota archaeon]|nr:hypothetical protein [Candidatus Bathyarchaeota archaeon]